MKKILSALLSTLMLLSALAGCSQDTGNPADTTAQTPDTTTAVPETTPDPNLRENHFDDLPADLNFGGATVNCLFYGTPANLEGKISSLWITNDVCGTDNIGDPISDAVWQRNLTVEQRLGVKLKWTPTVAKENRNEIQAVFQQTVLAGDSTYDYFMPTGHTSVSANMAPYVRDLANIPHVDYEQPWWWTFANEELSVDGKSRHFIVGDMLMTNLNQTIVLYFNKNIYENVHGNPEDMYSLTLDGKLTIDKLHELAEGAYRDLNGDGKHDVDDQHGLLWSGWVSEELGGWFAALDLKDSAYTRDSSGKITLTLGSERMFTAIEKLTKLLHNNKGTFNGAAADMNSLNSLIIPFSEGDSLFAVHRLGIVTNANIRDMKDNYGILPTPKMDENQERYYAYSYESGTVLCVPKSTAENKLPIVGAVFEALNGEAHRTYITPFLESAMKAKYSRDSQSAQCIDIIMEGLTKNILLNYGTDFQNIVTNVFYKPISSGNGIAASSIQSFQAGAQKSWDDMVASLEKHG